MGVPVPSLVGFFWLVIVFCMASSDSTDCPLGCTCSPNHLDCSIAGLTRVPTNLSNAMNITVLNLAINNITQIRVEDLGTFLNLRIIDLSYNAIESIQERAFSQLPHLSHVDLKQNFLTSLPNYTFKGLFNLTSVDVCQNKLTSLGKAFNDAPSLSVLNLENNYLTSVSADAFNGTVTLTDLVLKQNHLTFFPTIAVKTLHALETLDLSQNKIYTLGHCTCLGLTSLKYLQLGDNILSNISDQTFDTRCVEGETPPDGSSLASPLQTLDLNNNLLSTIPKRALNKLPGLRSLNLNSNNIRRIEQGDFANFTQLFFLSISYTPRLKSIANESFINLPSLHSVFIHDCVSLTEITPTVFKNVSNLKSLKVNGNGFQGISPDLLKWAENISLTLSFNPFHCNCSLQWLPEYYNNDTTPQMSRLNIEGLVCSSPEKLKGSKIVSLQQDQFRCRGKKKSVKARLHTAIIAASVCGIVAILLILFVKFRNRICIVVKRQFRYKAHRDNRELFSVKLSEIMIENDHEPFYDDTNLDLRPFQAPNERNRIVT